MDASLDHLPKRKRDDLARLVDLIRREVGPSLEMIILYGSYARGDWKEERHLPEERRSGHASDYDILILTSTAQKAREIDSNSDLDRKAAALELSAQPGFIAYDVKGFNNRLSKGRYFYVDILREGRMLHDSGRAQLGEPKTLSAAERYQMAQEYFDQWYTQAEMFYDTYLHHYKKGVENKNYFKLAAFDLHQAAEACLKMVLLIHTHYSPDEHWLKNLIELAAKYDPELLNTLPRGMPEENRHFKLLDAAYIGARYDKNYKIVREELDYLGACVKAMLDRTEATGTGHLAQLKSQQG